jgi:hypothetical protein
MEAFFNNIKCPTDAKRLIFLVSLKKLVECGIYMDGMLA